MKSESAKEIGNIFGWLILAAALPTWVSAIFLLNAFGSFGSDYFFALAGILLNPAFLLANAGAILLILKRPAGFTCLYVSMIAGLIWLAGPILPWLKYVFPAGPEFEYYAKTANIAAVVFLSYCHWQISSALEPRAAAGARRVIVAFLILLIPALIYWKTGIHTGNDEVQTAKQLPSIGQHLATLQSTQPILYRSIELRRPPSATVVFRGMTDEKQIRDFAAAYNLKLMTNDEARVKLLPIAKTWKLDPDRFPVFTNATDLCYIGRIPTNSHATFQLTFRPADGRFTAMSMGNPNEPRAPNRAVSPKN